MTIETEGLLVPVMFCDGQGCAQELTDIHGDGEFMSLVRHAKESNWKITKDADGDWVHYCPECRKEAV
jgi:hypothetical protein